VNESWPAQITVETPIIIPSWCRPAGVEPWIDTNIQLRNNACYGTDDTVTK